MKTKHIRAPLALKADGLEGEVSAVVSTFNVVDSDNDVVLASAFTDGQAVPMVWSHNWDLPVGKGVIRVQADRAVFEGRFFTDTTAGLDAYRTVKNMAELQEYSWGFQILEAENGSHDGRAVRFIKRSEVFEVSPVLVGANRQTYTLDIKGAKSADTKCWGDFEPAVGSFEALASALGTAFRERQISDGRGYTRVVATYTDRFVAMLYRWDDDADEPSYWDVPYTRGADGAVQLGDPRQVELQTSFVPTGKGMPFDDHSEHVRVAVREWVKRAQAGSALRLKEGRAIPDARRESMAAVSGSLTDALAAIGGLMTAAQPAKSATSDVMRLRHEHDRTRARLAREYGVPA